MSENLQTCWNTTPPPQHTSHSPSFSVTWHWAFVTVVANVCWQTIFAAVCFSKVKLLSCHWQTTQLLQQPSHHVRSWESGHLFSLMLDVTTTVSARIINDTFYTDSTSSSFSYQQQLLTRFRFFFKCGFISLYLLPPQLPALTLLSQLSLCIPAMKISSLIYQVSRPSVCQRQ